MEVDLESQAILFRVVIAALLLAVAAPAHAEQRDQRPSKTATIVKWTLVGAAVGAAAGFGIGFRAYDDATFAERKITRATAVGAAIGAGGGFVFGHLRSKASSSPLASPPSLWTPSSPMKRSPNDRRYVAAR